MKITVFGANGAIGRIVTGYALRNGDIVTAYVRKADSLDSNADNLKVITGDLLNRPLIEKAVKDSDVVISTLGPDMDISRKNKGTPIADGHEEIINAMEKTGKKRFITLATPTIRSDDDVKSFCTVVPPLMAKILFPNAYRDMKKAEALIKKSSLDWTVVRMINPNATHKDSGYNISTGGAHAKMAVSRENVGLFIYNTAMDKSYIRKMPIVFNK